MQALQNFKTYFFRGLMALLSTVLAVWRFVRFCFFLQRGVPNRINLGMVRVLVYSSPAYLYIIQRKKV